MNILMQEIRRHGPRIGRLIAICAGCDRRKAGQGEDGLTRKDGMVDGVICSACTKCGGRQKILLWADGCPLGKFEPASKDLPEGTVAGAVAAVAAGKPMMPDLYAPALPPEKARPRRRPRGAAGTGGPNGTN